MTTTNKDSTSIAVDNSNTEETKESAEETKPKESTTVDATTLAAAASGTKREAPASVSEDAKEPPTKKATTNSSLERDAPAPKSSKGPPLLPMDFSGPDRKRSEPRSSSSSSAAALSSPASHAVPPAKTASTKASPATVTTPVSQVRNPPQTKKGADLSATRATTTETTTTKTRQPRAAAAAAASKTKSQQGATALQPKPSGTNKSSSSNAIKKASAADANNNKNLKGLRHFSMMVCKKVEEKGQTTYNEVADELVKLVIEERRKEESNGKLDEKNIRRRVYDSINVLLAMDIIAKDKKQISWKGLPSSAQHDLQLLEREEQFRKERVQGKRRMLQEILVQQICFRNLVTHNKEREVATLHAEKVPLPFIVVNTHKEAVINCNMAPDLSEVLFEFDRPFEINDDNSVLTRLGMHKSSKETLLQMVPEDLVTYCQEHGLLDSVLGEDGSEADPMVLTSVGSNKGQYFRSLE